MSAPEPPTPAPEREAAPLAAFHAGEVALQRAAGSAARLARVGAQIMRPSLTEQQRAFFPLLPFVVVGSLDSRGWPVASLLAGPPGFVSSPEPQTVRVSARAPFGDPLAESLAPGAPLGLLGIQPHTRRRNRVNGRVLLCDGEGFTLGVAQSFGNCPKYITARELAYAGAPEPDAPSLADTLGSAQRALLERADTFFIASAHPDAAGSPQAAHGVDVSHRGGPAGFIHFIDDATFIIPDLRGNDFYNTLGNLQLMPRAGLFFIDFERRDLLSLDVIAELLAGPHPLDPVAATGRIVRFQIQRARLLRGAAALRVVGAGE